MATNSKGAIFSTFMMGEGQNPSHSPGAGLIHRSVSLDFPRWDMEQRGFPQTPPGSFWDVLILIQ